MSFAYFTRKPQNNQTVHIYILPPNEENQIEIRLYVLENPGYYQGFAEMKEVRKIDFEDGEITFIANACLINSQSGSIFLNLKAERDIFLENVKGYNCLAGEKIGFEKEIQTRNILIGGLSLAILYLCARQRLFY